MDRVPTGIKGFDELIEGGLPKGSNTLITGMPGTGKTIFGLHYLYNGAKKGENGVYVTLDTNFQKLKLQAMQFGWDFDELEKQGKVAFVSAPLTKTKFDLFGKINDAKELINAKRLIFDNLATFAINLDLLAIPQGYAGNIASSVEVKVKGIEGLEEVPVDTQDKVFFKGDPEKRMIYLIINELSKLGTTNVIITYANPERNQITVDGVSEFVCDGVIDFKALAIGDSLSRTVEIKKMRYTQIDGGIKSYEIGKQGLSMLR